MCVCVCVCVCADGRLHHISEGIRHRLSLANTQDTDPAASFNPAPAPSEKGAGHPSYLRSHSSPAIQHVYSDPLVQHSRSADDVPPTGTAGDRTSHMPLLGNEVRVVGGGGGGGACVLLLVYSVLVHVCIVHVYT